MVGKFNFKFKFFHPFQNKQVLKQPILEFLNVEHPYDIYIMTVKTRTNRNVIFLFLKKI